MLYELSTFPRPTRGCVVTIGNFDGVHRGHLSLVERALSVAKSLNLDVVCLTFDPHPVEFFRGPDYPAFRLSSIAQRHDWLREAGAADLVVLPFSKEVASMSPTAFATSILVESLGAQHVVVGYDFAFGRGRSGSFDDLAGLGSTLGFGAERVDPVTLDAEPISSTRVRNCVRRGQMVEAERLLTRPFELRGCVAKGDQRGRELGFPTANLVANEYVDLSLGIYVTSLCSDGTWFPSVTSVGTRPTFYRDGERTIETFVFDQDRWLDLYDKEVWVRFHKRVRDELAFSGIEPLIERMNIDVEEARAWHLANAK